jgi:hypothetical protein
MANRVLLDQNGLKISRPTVNVLTASAFGDFLFSSQYQAMHLYMWGEGVTADLGPGQVNGNNAIRVNFGETLAVHPYVSAMFRYPAGDPAGSDFFQYCESGAAILQFRSYPTYLLLFNSENSKRITVRYSIWRPIP